MGEGDLVRLSAYLVVATVPHRLRHDCRRTAARNLIRAVVPERIAMLPTRQTTGRFVRMWLTIVLTIAALLALLAASVMIAIRVLRTFVRSVWPHS